MWCYCTTGPRLYSKNQALVWKNAGSENMRLLFFKQYVLQTSAQSDTNGCHKTEGQHTLYCRGRSGVAAERSNVCGPVFLWWGMCLPPGEETSSSVCGCVQNPTRKHGRPPNQEGSANKPPVNTVSTARLLFLCGAHISNLTFLSCDLWSVCLTQSLMWRGGWSVLLTCSSPSSTSSPHFRCGLLWYSPTLASCLPEFAMIKASFQLFSDTSDVIMNRGDTSGGSSSVCHFVWT